MSVGEALMTLRISAVAVCCSRASLRSAFLVCSSLQPRVLDGDHRLVGERLHQLDLNLRKRPGLGAGQDEHADHIVPAEHGDTQMRAIVSGLGEIFEHIVRVVHHVGDVNDGAIEHGTSCGTAAMGTIREYLAHRLLAFRRVVVARQERDHLTVEPYEGALLRLAETPAAGDDGTEHRLHVRGRATDHAEDLAGGRLLVQGLRHRPVARLQLLEQADVLDGNDRLVGKGLQKGDLALREELRLGAAEVNRADADPFAQQGNDKDRAEAKVPRVLTALWEFVDFGLHVSDVDGPLIQHGPATDRPADEGEGVLSDGAHGNGTVMSGEDEPVAIPPEDGCVE